MRGNEKFPAQTDCGVGVLERKSLKARKSPKARDSDRPLFREIERRDWLELATLAAFGAELPPFPVPDVVATLAAFGAVDEDDDDVETPF